VHNETAVAKKKHVYFCMSVFASLQFGRFHCEIQNSVYFFDSPICWSRNVSESFMQI